MQYFGQKDLSNSADHENGLLEKLVNGKIGQQASVDSSVNELCEAVEQLLEVSKIPGQLGEAKTTQSEISHKMSIFEEKGVAEKLRKQAVYTTDKTKLGLVKEKIKAVVTALKKTYDANKEVSSALSDYTSEYNAELVSEGQRILDWIDQQLIIIGNAIQQIQTHENDFAEVINKLTDEVTVLSDEFAEIKREINSESLDADTFVQLTADMEKAKERLKQLDEKSKTKESIEAAFKKAVRERNDTLLELFKAYELEADRINNTQNELRIEIVFKGDKEGFKAKLKSDFRGTGIGDSKYQSLTEMFADYVALIEDWILTDGTNLKKVLTSTEYGKMDAKLREQYKNLMSYQVQNMVTIYYHNKLLKQHSIGQRASALILFILTQDNNDIIFIDQPEDDLDNKVIYDEVIRTIVQKKTNIQFLFATHNANIPVLGDAERILVVDYQDTRIAVSQGNIDHGDTHKQIVDIMEGGKDAFEKRQLIYESW